jgi:Flp pilus assembly protein TadD
LPANAKAWAEWGRLLNQQGRFADAEQVLSVAADEHEFDSTILFQLARAVMHHQQTPDGQAEALRLVRESTRLNNKNPQAQLLLAKLLKQQPDVDWAEVVPVLTRVCDLSPNNASAQYQRALALEKVGKTEEADGARMSTLKAWVYLYVRGENGEARLKRFLEEDRGAKRAWEAIRARVQGGGASEGLVKEVGEFEKKLG